MNKFLTQTIILAFLLLMNFKTTAQTVENEIIANKKFAIDTAYINQYKEKIQVRFDINTDLRTFKFENPAPLKEFEVKPNQDFQSRISVGYKWLSLAFSFSPKIGSLNNDKEKGDSKIFGIEINTNIKRLNQQIYFRSVKGYYVSNTENFREELQNAGLTNKYIVLPEFKTTQFGSESFYYFNGEKLSNRMSKFQKEIQKKSVGSPVAYLGLHYTKIDGTKEDFSIIQTPQIAPYQYPILSKNIYAVAGFGYAYNYLITPNIYTTFLAVPVAGLQSSKVEFRNENFNNKNTDFTYGGIAELSLGYNTEKTFFGILGSLTQYTSPNAEVKVNGTQIYGMIYFGMRFDPPNKLKKLIK